MAAQPDDRQFAGTLTPDAPRRRQPTKRNAPFPWFGGKQALVPSLLPLLPAHDTYVEIFGGAGSLLFAKHPCKLEVYNDIDSELVNFFRVLRNPEQTAELQRLLDLTPYAREEWQDCRKHLTDGDDLVERARRWFVLCYQSFSGGFRANSWRHNTSTAAGTMIPLGFRNATARLSTFTQRLATVMVEHNDFAELIPAYDGPNVLYYADPPYLPETRKGGNYRHETTKADHVALLELLTTCKGMVILSGYDSPLYQDYLADWRVVRVETISSAAGRTRHTGLQGGGSAQHQKRTECIWIKPNTKVQPSLWEGVA